MAKQLLILNGSENDIPLILEAKKLGYHVWATGNDPSLMGYRYADEVRAADYSQKEGMLDLAREIHADAIVSNCNDAGIKSAAFVAEEMGLPGFDSYEVTALVHDKDKMKDYLLGHGIYAPASVPFDCEGEANRWAETASDYPYIAKPVDQSAGRGMRVARNLSELQDAIRYAFGASRHGHIIVESYLDGQLQSHSCFLVNQRVAAFYMTNEYGAYVNPFCVAGCCSPADEMDVMGPILNEEIEAMARDLKLVDGLVHTQFIVKGGKPYILEITRRHPGAWYHVCAGLATGISWPEWYVRSQVAAKDKPFPAFHGQSGVLGRYMAMADRNGVLKNITYDPELEKYAFDRKDFWTPGRNVTNYAIDTLAVTFLRFPSAAENARLRPLMPGMTHIEFEG